MESSTYKFIENKFNSNLNTTLFFLITYIMFTYFNPILRNLLANEVKVIPYFLVSIYIFFANNGINKVRKEFIYLIGLFGLAFISHALYYPTTIFADINLMMMLTATYCLIVLYRESFFITLMKFIYYAALFSLFVWPVIVIFDYFLFDIFGIFKSLALEYRDSGVGLGSRYSILIINWEELSYRNFGFFYEPAYAAQIYILGLILYEIFKNMRFEISNKYLFVFYLAILFTQSTGGWLVLFLHYLFFQAKIGSNRIVLTIPLLFVLILTLNSIGFLGAKIIDRAIGAVSEGDFHYYNGRLNVPFYIALYTQNPIFGYGAYVPLLNYVDLAAGVSRASVWNGYFSFLISYGMLIFVAYNYLLWKACKYFNFGKINLWTLKLFILIILAANASNHSLTPIFYFLPFWGLIYFNHKFPNTKVSRT